MRIIMLGPPGSGKGTQADKLAEKFKVPHVSTGDMFRAEKKSGTELGNKVREILESGNLVPDEITNQVLKSRIGQPDAGDGFILDGYPRNLGQADFIDDLEDIDFVIELKVSDDEVVRRISSRRVCGECGENFNTIFLKPQKEGVCDMCGGKLVQRDDSKPESVRKRLDIYHEKTKPLSDYYEEKGTLIEINGEQPIQKVFDDIIERISV